MRSYYMFRYITPIALMVGWILYQLVVKKKPWKELEGAAIGSAVFVLVWIGIAYLLVD